MGSHRLFVGGISPNVSQEKFESFIRKEVNVDNFTLKEKKDPEGVVLSKFAHINVFATPRELNDYVWSLNGKVWKGSKLRVEVAKESFMERLQREREEAARDKKNSSKSVTSTGGASLSYADNREKSFVSNQHEQMLKEHITFDRKVNSEKKKRTRIDKRKSQEDSELLEKRQGVPEFKGISQFTNGTGDNEKNTLSLDESNELDHCAWQPNKKKLKDGGQKKEDQMLLSFKKFSSVWADSDAEEEDGGDDESPEETERTSQEICDGFTGDVNEDKDSCAGDHDYTEDSIRDECNNQLEILSSILGTKTPIQLSQSRRPTQMTRYDPTAADHQKYEIGEIKRKPKEEQQEEKKVSEELQESPTRLEKKKPFVQVSEILNFKEKRESFSLLAQFAQQREEEGKELEVRKEVPSSQDAVVSASKPRIKTSNFFVDPTGKFIKDAVSWMVQPQTEEYLQSFAEIQPHLRELYKTRVARILRSAKATKGKLGRGRGGSRGARSSRISNIPRKREVGRGGRGGNNKSKS